MGKGRGYYDSVEHLVIYGPVQMFHQLPIGKTPLANQILDDSLLNVFAKELDFCPSNGLVSVDGDFVYITLRNFFIMGLFFRCFTYR